LAVRRITTLAFSAALLAATGWGVSAHAQAAAPDQAAPPASDAAPAPSDAAPADATPPAPKKHHKASMKGIHRGTEAGDAAVEDLNAKSLDAAKSGKSFAPPTTPAPEPAKAAKPMKHKHHAKKAAPPADTSAPDTSAPAPDTSAPPPDSTPK
jgi:hypothetical protein